MKIVLYTQRVDIIDLYNERRDSADQRIPQFIKACGYTPLAIPNNADIVKEIIAQIKPTGIILTGGNSLVKYGGNAPERDSVDNLLIKIAIDKKIPLYGFCRGMQSILCYFGNELVNVRNHVATMHSISGQNETRLVNSYHNQGCLNLKDNNLIALMKSDDGVIEMVKHKSLPIAGTMWHPERNNKFSNEDIALVKELMERKVR